MALLKNIENTVFITLNLEKISESPEWIGYELKVNVQENLYRKEYLRFQNTDCLYFENEMEPEIPTLYKSLELVAFGINNNYFFTPLDEKDFSFEISAKNNYFVVTLFLNDALLFGSYAWPPHSKPGLRMNVNKESILIFSNELKKEYEELFSPKLLSNK